MLNMQVFVFGNATMPQVNSGSIFIPIPVYSIKI